jgi:hypothetical protein
MTAIEALQIIQLLTPLIQQAINNGTMTITDADIQAAFATLDVDEATLQALINAKKAAGK